MRTIVENLVDGVLTIDEAGIVQTANPAAERIFGYSSREMIGRKVSGLMPEPYRSEHDGYLAAYAQTGLARVIGIGREVRGLRRDGSTFPMELAVGEFREGGRRLFTGIVRDISARREAEEDLRRREIAFEALAENSPLIIARFDLGLRHVYVNRAVEEATGRPREQFLGRTNRELGMPPDLNALWEGRIAETIRTRRPTELEFSLEGPSGSRHYYSRLVPEFGPDGSVVSILGVASDLTGLKSLQREVLSIAEQEQRRIGQDLHDDVGQELTGVGLMVGALADALVEAGSAEAGLAARIGNRLERARARVQALARGLVPMEVEALGLRQALQELAFRVTDLHGIEASVECEAHVLVAEVPVATQLFRIAQEAIANAIKHGKPRRIRIRLAQADGRTSLEVRDDGVGIPEVRGLGLGLKIMRYRADLLGASLEIGPAEGRGTRVACLVGGGRRDARSRGDLGPESGPGADRR